MSILLEPFQYEFFRIGMLAATLAGGLCALIGIYVVLRSMSYIGHGLSHAIFGGAVASYLAGINFFLGAGAWGVVSALIISRVARKRIVGADAAIGVVTTASFAFGVALISRSGGFIQNFESSLFGDVLGVTLTDVAVIAGVAAFAAALVFFGYRRLLFATFDPEVAEVSGIRTGRLDLLLAVTLAATVTATMTVLGVTMVAAVLVIPAVTARLLSDGFGRMLWISVATGAVSGSSGVYLSYYLDIASGAAVVLVATVIFLGAYVVSALRGRSSRLAPAA